MERELFTKPMKGCFYPSVSLQAVHTHLTFCVKCSLILSPFSVHLNHSTDRVTSCLALCVLYDKDHTSALRIKNTSESDPHSYEVT